LATEANFIKKPFWTAKFDVCYYKLMAVYFFFGREKCLTLSSTLKLDKSSLLEN
jgi:hypothetical protein